MLDAVGRDAQRDFDQMRRIFRLAQCRDDPRIGAVDERARVLDRDEIVDHMRKERPQLGITKLVQSVRAQGPCASHAIRVRRRAGLDACGAFRRDIFVDENRTYLLALLAILGQLTRERYYGAMRYLGRRM